jgi:hypothetical protein
MSCGEGAAGTSEAEEQQLHLEGEAAMTEKPRSPVVLTPSRPAELHGQIASGGRSASAGAHGVLVPRGEGNL